MFNFLMDHWLYVLVAWFVLSFPAGMLVGWFLREEDFDE